MPNPSSQTFELLNDKVIGTVVVRRPARRHQQIVVDDRGSRHVDELKRQSSLTRQPGRISFSTEPEKGASPPVTATSSSNAEDNAKILALKKERRRQQVRASQARYRERLHM